MLLDEDSKGHLDPHSTYDLMAGSLDTYGYGVSLDTGPEPL